MSATKDTPTAPAPTRYTDGRDRYVNFAEDFLGLRLAPTQKRILRALAEHQRIVVVSGNGVGKSFSVGMGVLGFLYTNPDSFVIGTSGSYGQFVDAMWRSMIDEMFEPAKELHDLPGSVTWGQQPSLEITKNWYAKIVSPKKPKGLEGRHAAAGMVVIEEADSDEITAKHLSSARSTATSNDDRIVVVANPPEDETDVVAQLLENPKYHTIQFSSFESHNAQVDAGLVDDEKIPGLVDLHTIKEDWEDYNGEPWPGWEEARRAHEERDDLAVDWYRRRAGVIPKENAAKTRPWYLEDVKTAVGQSVPPKTSSAHSPIALGVDLARKGGDRTVVGQLYDTHARFTEWSHTDHNQNYARICKVIQRLDNTPPIAVDAVGEGSGVADRLSDRYGTVIRFKAGEKALQESEYYNRWTEGLERLGQRLPNLAIDNADAREQLFAAARVLELAEKRRRSGDLLRATPKSELKDYLGESPDHLDTLVMSAWAAPFADRLNSDNGDNSGVSYL
ncbi:MAG: hypothetical protein ACLFR6_07770 [Salinarchaeum sp.]